MYHDVVYRNDELKRNLEQASREAAQGLAAPSNVVQKAKADGHGSGGPRQQAD